MKLQSKEFGIVTTNPRRLQERYRISHGVTLLNRQQAEQGGFRPVATEATGIVTPYVGACEPLLSLRKPSDQDVAAIMATPDTQRAIQLVRMRAEVAAQLLAQCLTARVMSLRPAEGDPYQALAPGIVGWVRGDRIDMPGQLHVSMSSKFPGQKVGDHIDSWRNVDTTFLIANMGPGDRWHRVIPAINRLAIGGPSMPEQSKFVQNHPAPQEIPVHWFKLAAPANGYVEAALNLPVAWATHDGSTIGSEQPSQAVMAVMKPIGPCTRYPSVV